jgi:cell division protease FtsH
MQPNSPNETPEPKGDNKGKGAKPPRRPIAPFLLVSALLLVMLVMMGSDPSRININEDAFWYNLYTGQFEQVLAFDDNSGFEATFRKSETDPKAKAIRATITVPDSRTIWPKVREIQAKAKDLEPSMPFDRFLADVKAGSILPLRGYPIRLFEPIDPNDPKSATIERQRFFLDFSDSKGIHYAEIDALSSDDSALDLNALLVQLRAANAPIEEGLTFHSTGGMRTKESSGFMMFLYSFGPILLFIGVIWFFMGRQMKGGGGGGLMNFGKSRAVMYDTEKRTGVTFADVAGIEEAKEEVSEIIEFLKTPEKFKRLGGRIPRGVMLVGSPGTGKTLLAKAIAGEADVPFISISGSDFVEMFVGVGASRVRDLFEQARKAAPCIIFLDEIDAVGRKRGSGMGGGNDEREQTLNAILVEMDGFGTDTNIIVCAATNRPDVLDSALMRPGRFDREIVIDLPDVKGREMILKVHGKAVKLDPSINLKVIAQGTPGFSGAELAALVNEAAILAAMQEHEWVTQADLEEARDKVRFGKEKKSRVMEESDKKITAYHEAGHAVLNCFLENTDPVHKVTIIPRGMALGATMMLPEKERMHYTRGQVLDELVVLYGGRHAETIFCDDITTGAVSDIQRATQFARLMVTEWGMSEKLGLIRFAERRGNDFLGGEIGMGHDHSESTSRIIDEEISTISKNAEERALNMLNEHKDSVESVAQALIQYETISGQEVRDLIKGIAITRQEVVADASQSGPPPMPDASATS